MNFAILSFSLNFGRAVDAITRRFPNIDSYNPSLTCFYEFNGLQILAPSSHF